MLRHLPSIPTHPLFVVCLLGNSLLRFTPMIQRDLSFYYPDCNKEVCFSYCITLYFRGRKISRKVNLKYFREKIFSRIYCSRENIFPRKYLPAKISSRENILSRKYLLAKLSSRENIFPRKYPPTKIVCLFRQLSFLFAVCCPVIGDTGSRPNVRSWIRITPAQQWHNSHHFESRSFLYLADEKHSARFFQNKSGWFDHVTNARYTDN